MWFDLDTKRIILDIYDAMQESIRTGQLYRPASTHRPPTRERRIRGGSEEAEKRVSEEANEKTKKLQ